MRTSFIETDVIGTGRQPLNCGAALEFCIKMEADGRCQYDAISTCSQNPE